LSPRGTRVHIPSGVPSTPPDATELARAFDLGAPLAPADWMSSGWGVHNQLWRLTTSRGRWAIKQVGRDLSLDPDKTLRLELAALARRRLPEWQDRILLGNAIDWVPQERFDFVRTGLEYVPKRLRLQLVRHLLESTPGLDGQEVLGISRK
jgi:hypothetical protein